MEYRVGLGGWFLRAKVGGASLWLVWVGVGAWEGSAVGDRGPSAASNEKAWLEGAGGQQIMGISTNPSSLGSERVRNQEWCVLGRAGLAGLKSLNALREEGRETDNQKTDGA